MADLSTLKSNCSQCAALCCIAYAAEESPAFAASKEAGEPCPNLDACGQCRIYDTRQDRGFSGCLQFECFGAGQRVVQTIFKGRDWRNDPSLLRPSLECFEDVRKACELLFLVHHARENQTGGQTASGQLQRMAIDLERIASSAKDPANRLSLARHERELKALFTAAAANSGG